MSSRPYIIHKVSNIQPPGLQVGDEYYNPVTNLLYKVLAINGTTVTASELVGATSTQTLSNKTISGANNTISVRLASDVTGTLPVVNGGTGVTTSTGTGATVLSTSPSLTTPNIGAATGTSVNLTGAAGVLTRAAATQDGVELAGRAGGTGSFKVSLIPTTLTANRTVTLADGNTTLQAGTMAVTGTNLSQFASTTSSQLAGVISDETGSGNLVFATSPTLVTPILGTPTSGTLSGCTVDGTNAVGFRTLPQNSQSAAYTLVLADSGKHIFHPSADTTARIWTIPANGSVAFPIGTAITFINQNGAGVITIAITTDTMRLAGAGTTGSRTLAANGIATAIKITATEWIISGTGLT